MLQEQLEESFAFYAAYHQNNINKIIHMITIPLISITLFVFLAYLPNYQYGFENKLLNDIFSVTFAIPLIVLYLGLYLMMDWKAGCLMIPYILLQYFLANLYRFNVPYGWIGAIVIFVLSWIFQFMGHGIWEGRKPALSDSLVQSFLMAPFFVFFEILFMCGFRKEFQQNIDYKSQFHDPLIQT
jgi:uncharacterized membrane protein YGL010W